MFFWRKNKAKEIKNELKRIKKLTESLIKFEDKIKVTQEIIQTVKSNISEAKNDILERAKEEKSKPWIDSGYGAQINQLAEQEVKALEKLCKYKVSSIIFNKPFDLVTYKNLKK